MKFDLFLELVASQVTKISPPHPQGLLPYGLNRYVLPQRVESFSRLGHKKGINFGHFGLK